MIDALNWLLAPVDPARPHVIPAALSWHARIMVVAWVVIAPVAVLIARYFKITPRQNWPRDLDNPFWWRVHWMGQSAVLILSVLALAVIVGWGAGDVPARMHRGLGYALIVLAMAQAASGGLRGTKGGPTDPAPDGSWAGDHYDMTRHRLIFEAAHRGLGVLLLLLSVVVTWLGLWAANAPWWMWLVIVGWWGGMILAAIWLQVTRGAADTYQAIWGPDPVHPGNRMKKQGWGTHRPSERR